MEATAAEPRYEWEVMSGVLWKVGGGATPLNYVVLPQIISLKIPPISERPWRGGTLVLRSRFSLLLEPIVVGAAGGLPGELHKLWRSRTSDGYHLEYGYSCMGYEIAGGQGQDFNLNWLVHTGIRYRTKSGWRWSAGAYFQHISNRGMNKINPGLNSLGPTLAVSRRF